MTNGNSEKLGFILFGFVLKIERCDHVGEEEVRVSKGGWVELAGRLSSDLGGRVCLGEGTGQQVDFAPLP